jgi:hypothetical protein
METCYMEYQVWKRSLVLQCKRWEQDSSGSTYEDHTFVNKVDAETGTDRKFEMVSGFHTSSSLQSTGCLPLAAFAHKIDVNFLRICCILVSFFIPRMTNVFYIFSLYRFLYISSMCKPRCYLLFLLVFLHLKQRASPRWYGRDVHVLVVFIMVAEALLLEPFDAWGIFWPT